MIYVTQKRLSKIFADRNLRNTLFQIIYADNLLVQREAKKQVPKDRNDLGRSIQVKKLNQGNVVGYDVYTTKKYAMFVHEGTLRYRGTADAGYTTGRSRASNFMGFLYSTTAGKRGKSRTIRSINEARNLMVMFIRLLTKWGKFKGIRPNKFMDRAKKESEPDVRTFFQNKFKILVDSFQ